MNTTMTTGNIRAILLLAEQKGLVPDRATRIIASAVLADAFDKDADLSDRHAWRAAFKLPPLLAPSTLSERERWLADGWGAHASSVTFPTTWDCCGRIFPRN